MKRLLGLGLGLVLIALTACQSLSAPAAAPAPAAVDSAVSVSPADSTAIWGQVPKQCACHADREPLAVVASQLEYAQVDANFHLESTSQGFEIFSVTFNPSVVSAERITEILRQAGAIIIPAPV